MPRRRLIDPSFNDDIEVSKLTRDERLFVIGCLSNADDEGRLHANRSFLKSKIFMYDDDIDYDTIEMMKESTLDKMSHWHTENIWRLEGYSNGELEYIHFPNWYDFNKPSHPTPSKLPSPPKQHSGMIPEKDRRTSGTPPEPLQNDSALSQVKSGQDRLSKDKFPVFDFKSLINSEEDLTDFLTTTLTEYASRGPVWLTSVLSEFWRQTIGKKMSETVFTYTSDAVKKYSPEVLARAFVRTAKYQGGKTGSYKYLQKVLEEKAAQ